MTIFYKTEIPFLRLSLIFTIGILFSIFYNLNNQWFWIIFGLITLFILGYINFFFIRYQFYLKTHINGFFIQLIVFILGVLICNQHKEINHPTHFSKFPAEKLIVCLTDQPKINGDIAKINVEVKQYIYHQKIIRTSGKLLLALKFDTIQKLDLQYGDLCLIESKLKEIDPPYNPSEFNYKKYLSYQQIYHQSFINQKQLIKIDSNQGNPIKAFALNFRLQQVQKFNKYLKNEDAKAVAATLILGYRADLSQDILNAYGKTGTMHVLSVSGMHVAIVVVLLGYLLAFMDRNKKTKIIKAIIMVVLIWFYALITGLDPSVSRAAIMLSFIIIGNSISRKVNILNVLGLTAFILLIYNPFYIANVGFQLSFLAVGGLIYLQPKIKALYQPENKILKIIWTSISVSIAAQLATTPISIYYFHNFPLYFLISNLFIAIPATLMMYVGLAFLFCGWWPILMTGLGYLLNELIIFTNKGLIKIEHFNYATISQIWLSMFEIILLYSLFLIIVSSYKNKIYLKLALVFLFVLILDFGYQRILKLNQKQIIFFSLRKNNAVALIKGNNAILISDLKPNEFTYSFSVKPYLDSCKITHLKFINPSQSLGEKIIDFEGHQLKIIDHKSDIYLPSKADWLLLSGIKIQKINQILSANKFDHLFLDGKNSDKVISVFQNKIASSKIKIHILKREKAVEIKL